MARYLRVVHYLNQFFGQVGGEESANIGPRECLGAIGPALAVNNALGKDGEVVASIICGDNYIAENLESAAKEIVHLIKKHSPDIVLAGPAFNSGRYGVGCGEVCKQIKAELDIPAITGMFEDNPGVELYKKEVIIVKVGNTAASMRAGLTQMLALGKKILDGESLNPQVDNYFIQGYKRSVIKDKIGAQRAVDMLLKKIRGEEFTSEVNLPVFEKIPKAPPLKDLSKATIALTTDGGLYPSGNPDKIESAAATKYGKYNIAQVKELNKNDYEVHHRGYDNTYVEEDPNRLVPVDVMRKLEEDGKIGSLYQFFFSTTGVITTLDNAKRIGRQISDELKNAGVDAVIHTST